MRRIRPENALLWCPFDGRRSIAGQYRTTNLGRALSAPSTLLVGNGVTATTFPADLPHGMRFDAFATDYLKLETEPLTRSTPFTCAVLVDSQDTVTPARAYIATLNVALVPIQGWSFASIGAGRVILAFYDSNGMETYCLAVRDGVMQRFTQSPNFFAATYNGSSLNTGISVYVNGNFFNDLRVGGPITGTIAGGQGIGVGTRWSGAALDTVFVGDMLHASIYPFAATLQELRTLEYRARQMAVAP